jgi:signal transduction histidine kinase
VVVRVAVDDASLPALNPTRPENRSARTTLLTRLGDSVVVVATASNESAAVPRRGFALREVPPHVRAALDGRPAEGTGRGLFRPRVVHAAAPLPELGWAMVREVDADWLLGQYTTAIVVEETVFATIAVLAAFLVVSRVRAARARRDGALAQLRADFVSGVSHELRTPLAQIRMFAELLRKRALRDEDDAERALRIIEKEAGRLTILVDNVLNYARLRREPATVRWITPVPADVAAEARQVLESFAPLAAERGARLALDVEEGPRAVIDPQALRQVLLNFLENAVKYGPRGGTVTLGARAAPAAAPAGATRPAAVPRARVRIWVDDEGPGVPPAERERVWEAFHRSEAAVRSGVGGSGLGLAVVRDLVAHAGGTVRVESAPGGGARFVAELPMVGPVTA